MIALAQTHSDWAVGFEDECWWSRLARPSLHAWTDDTPLRLVARDLTTLILVWDNASWHLSRQVRSWLRGHNQRAHREGGVRIVPCWLPSKSPWLNPIEPTWVHGQRRMIEPTRLLTARDIEERVCAAFGCPLLAHLAIPQEVS